MAIENSQVHCTESDIQADFRWSLRRLFNAPAHMSQLEKKAVTGKHRAFLEYFFSITCFFISARGGKRRKL